MANYYKGSFVNTQVDYSDNSPNEQTIYVKITDVTVFDGSEVALELADAPVTLQTVDNSEDKFTTIKSKSCTLRVFTSNQVNAMTFADGGDNQYKVEIAINSESDIIYTGWLSISDLGQTFQPDPNILVLTASDGIAFLRDVPLSDSEDRFLTGPHALIRYISWCLQKTGLDLEIWIQMNLLEENAIYDYPEYHFYNYVYLDAQTFEAEVGVLENCYSVLEKILGEFCEISQQKNVWFIKSIDEAGYQNMRICQFDYDGTPLAYQTVNYLKEIGPTETMAFMNDDARLSLQRPFKYVEQTFNYDYPVEAIKNSAFERGVLIDESNPLDKIYAFDDWTMIQGVPGYYAAPSSNANIHRIYNVDGGEIAKYLVVTPKPWTGMSLQLQTYLQSQSFYVQTKDKFSISVDWRLENNIGTGGGNYNLLQVVLKGDDGSWWILGVPTIGSTEYTWYDTSNWTTNTGKALISVDWDLDLTQWQSVNWDAPPCPVDGKLYAWLYQFNQISNSPDDVDIWYANFTFTYTPYINGSYQAYTGQRHKSEQAVDNKASRSNDVFMSDSPKKELKGAIMRRLLDTTLYTGNAEFSALNSITLDGFLTPYFNVNDYIRVTNTTSNNQVFRLISVNYSSTLNKTVLGTEQDTVVESDASTTIQDYAYQLTDAFYDSIEWPGGGVPTEDIYPYGQHQNQAVWNQFNRVFSAFEATIDGLDTDTVDSLNLPNLPDLLHCYQQTDSHPATDYKQFKVLHYEQDTDNCEWSLYMIEVTDSNYPKTYIGHSFKYVQK